MGFSICHTNAFACSLCWGTTLFVCCLVLPATVYRYVLLWDRQKAQVLWVRRISLDLFPLILMLLQICVLTPLSILSAGAKVLDDEHFYRMINAIGFQFALASVVYRVLLVHCDLAFAYVNKQLQWQKLIVSDEMECGVSTSKYVQWRTTWLSPCFIGILPFSNAAFASFCQFVAFMFFFGALPIVTGIFGTLVTVLVVIIWHNTPDITDTFGIREEIKLIGFSSLFFLVCFVAVILLQALGIVGSALGTVLGALPAVGNFVCIIYVYTEYRWKLLPEDIRKWDAYTKTSISSFMRKSSMASSDESSGTGNGPRLRKNSSVQSLSHTPRTRKSAAKAAHKTKTNDLIYKRLFLGAECISLFADFLFHEFSIENLIGLIEFYQYAQSLKTVIGGLPDGQRFAALQQIVMDDTSVPLSSINRMDACAPYRYVWHNRFMTLCDKYVGDDAMYQLNIPYRLLAEVGRMQERIRGSMGSTEHGSADDEIEVMDVMIRLSAKIVGECVTLIKDSFVRFSSGDTFDRFMEADIADIETPASKQTEAALKKD